MANYSSEEVSYYHNAASPYLTAHQDNFDKYALFVERSLNLLAPSGRLGVIIPHKFMTTQAGRALRRLVSTPRLIEQVVHFGAKQVFGRRAANYTCILVLDRRGCNSVNVEHAGPLEEWRYGAPGTTVIIQADSLGEDNWQFADAEASALFTRIRTAHPRRLEDVADVFVGVQTSADGIFIFEGTETLDNVVLRWSGLDWPIEKAILRPCLMDVSLHAYMEPRANKWIIFPYEIADGPRSRRIATLIQPDEMARRFPNCLAYLAARREELESRGIIGGRAADRQFYQFGRSQSLTKFGSAKIILPILSTEPRYTYDEKDTVVTGGGNGPYYMVRAIPEAGLREHFLLAVLNHPLSEAMVRTNTSLFRGGYYSHGKQYIDVLPVPTPSQEQQLLIETLVKELIGVLQDCAEARTPHARTLYERRALALKSEIEQHVSVAFGLSQADMEVVRAVAIPT